MCGGGGGGVTKAGLGRGTSWAVVQTPRKGSARSSGSSVVGMNFHKLNQIEAWGLGVIPP